MVNVTGDQDTDVGMLHQRAVQAVPHNARRDHRRGVAHISYQRLDLIKILNLNKLYENIIFKVLKPVNLITVGAVKNETLFFINFSAQDASILKISVAIIKRRSWGFQNTPNL